MIYTSIFGRRDPPRSDIRCFEIPLGFEMPRMNAKVYKVLSHLFVPEDSVWIDGNIFPRVEEAKILEMLGEYDMAAFKHPWRNTVKEELDTLLSLHHIDQLMHNVFAQAFFGYLALPLFECGILIRRNNDRVRSFNEKWWKLVRLFPPRDQITFPLAANRVEGLRVKMIDANMREHKYFEFRNHGTR